MGLPTPRQLSWIIEPLVDAGLDHEQITSLVFDLGFETMLSGADPAMTHVAKLVHNQPAPVQAAWWHAVGRMISAQGAVDRS